MSGINVILEHVICDRYKLYTLTNDLLHTLLRTGWDYLIDVRKMSYILSKMTYTYSPIKKVNFKRHRQHVQRITVIQIGDFHKSIYPANKYNQSEVLTETNLSTLLEPPYTKCFRATKYSEFKLIEKNPWLGKYSFRDLKRLYTYEYNNGYERETSKMIFNSKIIYC